MTLKVATCVKYDECRCKVMGNLQWSFELYHGTANKKSLLKECIRVLDNRCLVKI